jgi:hypothetical protein
VLIQAFVNPLGDGFLLCVRESEKRREDKRREEKRREERREEERRRGEEKRRGGKRGPEVKEGKIGEKKEED